MIAAAAVVVVVIVALSASLIHNELLHHTHTHTHTLMATQVSSIASSTIPSFQCDAYSRFSNPDDYSCDIMCIIGGSLESESEASS